ncbi:hypothetical protein VTK56DRAFT_5901 [Thermocarpiscus australiensis]
MVGLYDDPFAYDGSDFTTYLGPDHPFAAGSSPDDFHVTSATEPHFPAIHPLKAAVPLQQSYLPPTGPVAATLENGPLPVQLQLEVSAPAPFPADDLMMGLAWDTTTPRPGDHQSNPNPSSNSNSNSTTNDLIQTLQTQLAQTARERDEARMQLATARNELYAARQVGKRLRAERDEARAQAEFLAQERAKARETESRLRRERNEARARLAAAAAAVVLKGGKKGVAAGVRVGVKTAAAAGSAGGNGLGVVGADASGNSTASKDLAVLGAVTGESQGEESTGESPTGQDQG